MKQNVLHNVQEVDSLFAQDVKAFLKSARHPSVINIMLIETLCRCKKKIDCSVLQTILLRLNIT